MIGLQLAFLVSFHACLTYRFVSHRHCKVMLENVAFLLTHVAGCVAGNYQTKKPAE